MGLPRLRSIALGIAVLATTSCVTSKAVKQEKKDLVRDFMIQLEELGRRLGADPSSWHATVPEIHWLDEFQATTLNSCILRRPERLRLQNHHARSRLESWK